MKNTILLTLVLSLSSCKNLIKITEAPSMALSKDMCSCLFVAEQTMKYCREITVYHRIFGKYKVNREAKTVFAKGLGKKALSKYQSDRLGCTIVRSY